MDTTRRTPQKFRQSVEGVVESRRRFLKGMAVAGGAVATGAVAAPHVAGAQANGLNFSIQSSWQPGTTGYHTFENWCNSMVELTSGELALTPFPAGAVSGDFQLFDAVRNGVLDGMNVFTVYWAGRMPAGVFLSSYPMGPNHPHQWDMMFDSYGGRELARELYERNGLYFVGHVHHDMNLIHSTRPINSLDDFDGLLLRVPGGIVADCFAAIGARTTLLPGSEVYPALERGTIEAADFVGPAVNYELGFQQVTNVIVMGPPSTPCLHQPVDLMDISFSLRAWNQLSDQMKELVEELVKGYSRTHYAAIQAANAAAWPLYTEAGTTISRLSEEDVARFRQVAIPLWFDWANRDHDAARLFNIHLQVMQDPEIAYLSPDDIAGYTLDL
ncbi:MAG: TRAP transporter substrate-binding protein DctP [Rhodospirillaceae bacterium]|nr:TRAP transporter substrate-binding protein DctP [Rhodospirillaceae bacterium]